MRLDGIIENVHDIEIAMSWALSDIAEYDIVQNGWGVPTTLFSDYAIDVVSINKPEHVGKPFLWHTHSAGTYMHYMYDNIKEEQPSYEAWKSNFRKFDDWPFTELTYNWDGGDKKTNRYFYYDGDRHFREVSKETALLIWQYTGKQIIAEREKVMAAAV